MRLHSTIALDTSSDITRPDDSNYWIQDLRPELTAPESDEEALDKEAQLETKSYDQGVQSGSTYYFDEDECTWSIYAAEEDVGVEIETLTAASYNVLMETEYPPTDDRDPALVSNILSDSAMADVLALQEVSDEFLSYLLNDTEIQRRYPFASYGPPTQPDIGPLSNLRNIVILSCYPFSWKSVPFHRKHKGAIVAQFRGVAVSESSGSEGLVVAGVHLTAGLTDGAVATKKAQMKTLISYLERNHKEEPWVVTGDFNIITSSYTIDAAIQDKSITDETANTLTGIETAISDAGLLDAWSVSRVEATDQPSSVDVGELFEGEEGATFDPQNNKLAAGTTTTSHDRPQRYDRILVRPKNVLRVCRFNQFGHADFSA
jgi:endonuclease/exonuclease/phosphatase family metal-dependent hydrolase